MNQPNEGMRERFEKRYTNSVVNFLYKGDRDEVINFIQSEIDLALAKQRSDIVEMIKRVHEEFNGYEVRHSTDEAESAQEGADLLKDLIISTITKDTKD